MKESRRNFMKTGAGAAVTAGTLGMLSSCNKEETETAAGKEEKKTMMVGACGLSCSACPLLKNGKCKGCGPGNAVAEAMVTKKNCPVLNCASKKKIAYCGTDCAKYTECAKLIGKPFDKGFMDKLKSRMG